MPPKKRKSHKRKSQRGGNKSGAAVQKAAEALRDIGRLLKDSQLVSKGADALGFNNAAQVIGTVGLGRRRRGRKGGSWAGDVLGTVGKIAQAPLAGLYSGIGSMTNVLSGLGQRGGYVPANYRLMPNRMGPAVMY